MLLEGNYFSHYRILRLIGRGGAGEVYLAADTQVPRQVAVKFIRIEMEAWDREGSDRALRLFWREASTVARLEHANILPLYEYGETLLENTALAYLIIPHCPEGSLTDWLRQDGQERAITLSLIQHIVQQAALGLQCAHDHQVMHLDVKPANFLIRSRVANDEYPDVLLSDFGIARLASATSSLSQHIRGTPSYMAPEQWANQPTFASDQYGLAIMVYELLTGSPPFLGAPMSVMYEHIHTPPASVCERNPLVPAAINLVLQRALAKEPEERYPSIIDFAQAFQEIPGESTLELRPPSQALPRPHHMTKAFSSHHHFAPPPHPPHFAPPARQDSASLDFATRSIVVTNANMPADAAHSPLPDVGRSSSQLPPIAPGSRTLRRPRLLIAGLIFLTLLVLVGASIGAYTLFFSKLSTQNAPRIGASKSTSVPGTTASSPGNTGGRTAPPVAGTSITATPTTRASNAPSTSHAYPAYLPGHGTFAFFDPLSRPAHWQPQAESATNGKCLFSGGNLHVFEFTAIRTFHCDGPVYSNFAFEVQMTITQGDCGGISFRKDPATHNFYQFDVCLDNKLAYLFSVANNNYSSLQGESDSSYLSGLNQPLLLAVVAQGTSLKLFVNHQQIISDQDSTYTQGDLALSARDDTASQTEVVYKNATVWTLP